MITVRYDSLVDRKDLDAVSLRDTVGVHCSNVDQVSFTLLEGSRDLDRADGIAD